jgi:hypothetical protein
MLIVIQCLNDVNVHQKTAFYFLLGVLGRGVSYFYYVVSFIIFIPLTLTASSKF